MSEKRNQRAEVELTVFVSGTALTSSPPISSYCFPCRQARICSRLCCLLSFCASSRRRRSSAGENWLLALKCVRRCSELYSSIIPASSKPALKIKFESEECKAQPKESAEIVALVYSIFSFGSPFHASNIEPKPSQTLQVPIWHSYLAGWSSPLGLLIAARPI